MRTERKTLSGVMNLDDPREVLPSTHHKEAKNGVFRGNGASMKFQSIPGNQEITNSNLFNNECLLKGAAVIVPSCTLAGTAVKTPNCVLAGTAELVVITNCSLDGAAALVGTYNQYVISEGFDLCGDSCYAGNSLNIAIYSLRTSVPDLMNRQLYADNGFTLYSGDNKFHKMLKVGTGSYYAVSIDVYGIVTDIRNCTNTSPGVCSAPF